MIRHAEKYDFNLFLAEFSGNDFLIISFIKGMRCCDEKGNEAI